MNNAISVARDTRNSLLGSTGVGFSSVSSEPSEGGFQDWSLSSRRGGEKSPSMSEKSHNVTVKYAVFSTESLYTGY